MSGPAIPAAKQLNPSKIQAGPALAVQIVDDAYIAAHGLQAGKSIPVYQVTTGKVEAGPVVPVYFTEGGVTAPVANFSANTTSGDAPLAVTFTDLSTNTPTSWDWDFGDLSAHSTSQNPAHTYSTPGTYTVTLIATNTAGSDTEIKASYITANINYFINDVFTTNRAAGAVNGTAAEPGPGTRNVTDLDSRITIAGSALTVAAGGTSAWLRTGIWYTPAVTRVAGQVIAMTMNFATLAALNFSITTVQDTNFSGYNNVGINAAPGWLFARRTTAGNSPEIYVPNLSQAERYYIIIRAQGRFIFVKSAGTTKFLWSDIWDATAALYLGLAVNNNGVAMTMDNVIALNNQRYSVLATSSDSFNRANGAPGSTDGAGHAEANSGSGKAWTANQGTAAISTNKLTMSALDGGGIGIATVDTGKQNEIAIVETTRSAGNVGLVVRYVDSDNYIYAYHDGTNAALIQRKTGVESNIVAPTVVTYAAGALLQISCDDTTFWLYYNQDYVGKGTSATAPTGTKHGIYTTNTGNAFDNWRTFARGNGGEYSDLGAY